MNDFVSLAKALEGYFDKPLNELPNGLREHVSQVFPTPWNKLSPDLRCELATQVDTLYDPASEQENLQKILELINDIEKQIEEWKSADAHTVSDVAMRKEQLLKLEKELAPLKQQLDRGDFRSWKPEDQPTVGADRSNSGAPICAVFQAMTNLTADELSITFVGDKDESGMGANNMLEISARGKFSRIAIAQLDLVDRRRGRLNNQCAILLGMAQKIYPKQSTSNSRKMTRLRGVFRKHLGIGDDPFERYHKNTGWMPRFKIDDKRGKADERAQREAERRTDSYEGLTESGTQFSDNDQVDQFDTTEDAADEWLKNNDPDTLS